MRSFIPLQFKKKKRSFKALIYKNKDILFIKIRTTNKKHKIKKHYVGHNFSFLVIQFRDRLVESIGENNACITFVYY